MCVFMYWHVLNVPTSIVIPVNYIYIYIYIYIYNWLVLLYLCIYLCIYIYSIVGQTVDLKIQLPFNLWVELNWPCPLWRYIGKYFFNFFKLKDKTLSSHSNFSLMNLHFLVNDLSFLVTLIAVILIYYTSLNSLNCIMFATSLKIQKLNWNF